jgi:aryl-alcohol dehydrogenase-like predicted oxidoreductase
MTLPTRPLGASRLQVSTIALGSWRTFERLPRERGVEILTRARDLGITFLDDARYDDETGNAPLATGYSEVLFGELFRAAGYRREEAFVSEKLWWEFWPRESAAAELDGSLGRLGFDYVDLIYAVTPPPQLGVEQAVGEIAGLLRAGKARAWGVAMWPAANIEAATRAAVAEGIDPPCAAQMAYSLVSRETAESAEMLSALRVAGAGLVASAALEGGLLTGKYDGADASGRLAGTLEEPASRAAVATGRELRVLADEWGTTAAALAVAFVLDHQLLASALVGATSPAQLDEIVPGVELHERLSNSDRARLRAVAN